MIHTEEVLVKTLETIKKQRSELQAPVHALVYGAWGVGKTVSAKKVTKLHREVFYLKAPADDISRSKLVKLVSYSVGAGMRQTLEATIDLLKFHISTLKLQPILIIDEAQRLFKRPALLDELKDLSEDEDIGLSYLFLADNSVARIIASTPHSLHKRISVKVELQPITEKTVRELADGLDWQVIYRIAREKGWTTLDVAVVVTTLKKAKLEATEENILKIANSLGR